MLSLDVHHKNIRKKRLATLRESLFKWKGKKVPSAESCLFWDNIKIYKTVRFSYEKNVKLLVRALVAVNIFMKFIQHDKLDIYLIGNNFLFFYRKAFISWLFFLQNFLCNKMFNLLARIQIEIFFCLSNTIFLFVSVKTLVQFVSQMVL